MITTCCMTVRKIFDCDAKTFAYRYATCLPWKVEFEKPGIFFLLRSRFQMRGVI